MASAQVDKEFWFAAPYVNDEGRDFDKPINVRITSLSSAATVTVSLPADASFTPITVSLAANSTTSIDLTQWISQLQNTPGNQVLNKGLLIKSTADITAYYEVVSSFCNCDPESFSLKGKNALGNEFFISSQYTYDESTAYAASNSFDIVATQNNTHVTIKPSNNIVGHAANVPFTITLNAGQTYSAVATSTSAAGHLQGSYITSDNPVAVTLKDDLVQVSSCADLAGDQTVPTNVLGTEYVVTKGYLDGADMIYVMAVEDGTSVYIDGNSNPTQVLSKGESITLSLSNPSTYIRTDKKVYVYQLTGNGCEVGSAIIPKLSCTGSQSVSIVRSSSDLFAVMITTKNGNQNSFTVNGNASAVKASDFSPVPGTGGAYLTARVDLSGFAQVGTALNFSNSTGKFSLGYINGGSNDGARYGFFSDFKSSNVQSSFVEACASVPTQLNAYGGVTYKWSPAAGLSNPNIANPLASPTATTDYIVAITTADGCVDTAKVHVKVNTVKKLDTVVTICQGSTYTLPSGRVVQTEGVYTDNSFYKNGCDSVQATVDLRVSSSNASITIAASGNDICAGTDVTFTTKPVGAGADATYQWQVNGTNAGTNSLTFSSSTLVNGDKVSCIMTTGSTCSPSSKFPSNVITMKVNDNLVPSLSITASKTSICAGTPVTFTAAPVNGGTAPSYQWFVNGVAAGTNSTTFTSSTLANGDKVTCIITSNAQCAAPATATSNEITIIVNPVAPPSVSIVESANNICPGEGVTFTATPVNGGTAPVYQWKVNGSNAGTNNPAFTSTTLVNGDVISCMLTSNGDCVTTPTAASNSVTMQVNTQVSPTVSISVSQNNICAGTPVSFTAAPVNGGASPVYEWQVNGTNTGTNSATFTSSTLANGDVVTCMLTSNATCAVPAQVKSNVIIMQITDNVPASVSIAASQTTVCAGTPVTFTVTPVNGGSTPVYQWLVNGASAGTNSSTFTSSTLANGDNITCTLTSNAQCAAPVTATSNVITMTVDPYVAPAVSITASATDICPGDAVTFGATPVNGGTAPLYQWLLNGSPAGNNSGTFTTSALADGDVISCVLTSNGNCITQPTATSNSISITVSAPVAPSVTITASQNNVCAGTSITFNATPVNGGAAPVYQWLVDGNNAGTNSDTFTTGSLNNGDVVSCRLTSSAHCAVPATVTSGVVNMIINPLPVIDAGDNKTINQGESTPMTATSSGNITDITWSPSEGLDNPKILNPVASPAHTTEYTVTVQSASGCINTSTVKITVLVQIIIPNTFTPNGDGVNDTWNIKNLDDYPDCTVKIFDRWGQQIYNSRGYYTAWDGTTKGQPVPFGTYYYVINLGDNSKAIGGWVAVIK